MSNRRYGGDGINPLFMLIAAAVFALGAFMILRAPNFLESAEPEAEYRSPAPIVAPAEAPAESPAPSEPTQAAPPAPVTEIPAPEPEPPASEPEPPKFTYALNTNTLKIHKPGCSSVGEMSPHNLQWTHKSLDELESEGYEKCKRCF